MWYGPYWTEESLITKMLPFLGEPCSSFTTIYTAIYLAHCTDLSCLHQLVLPSTEQISKFEMRSYHMTTPSELSVALLQYGKDTRSRTVGSTMEVGPQVVLLPVLEEET